HDGTTQVVGGDLDILVGNWWRLISKPLDLVDTKGLPQLWFPLRITGLESIRILVITKTELNHLITRELSKSLVEVSSGLVVVDLVFLPWPVQAVTESKDRVVDALQVDIGRVLEM